MKVLPGRRVGMGQAHVSQNSASSVNTGPQENLFPFLAEVVASYSDRMTCDILAQGRLKSYNVPVATFGGLIDSEIWGEKKLPQKGDRVIVMFLEGRIEKKVIIGTFLPFLNSKFGSEQVAANSSGKDNSTELLADENPKTVRRVYPSGITEEYKADGTLTIQTPQGGGVVVDTLNGDITLKGANVLLNGSSERLTIYSALNSALQSLVSSINTALGTKQDAAGTPGTLTVDISAAETSTIKTDG